MKRLFSILLAVCLITVGAYADVLTDDWKNATDAELQIALAEIQAELQMRGTATRDDGEAQRISGHGTAIEQITVTTVPARVTLTYADKNAYSPAKLTGGSKDIELNPYRSGIAEDLISEAGTYTALIETTDDWTLTVQPLANAGVFTAFSGDCSAFTDLFMLTGPVIATVSVEPANDSLGSFIVELWYQTDRGWAYDYESTLLADLTKDEAFTYDMILKPVDGATAYAIKVFSNYDGLGWKITAK